MEEIIYFGEGKYVRGSGTFQVYVQVSWQLILLLVVTILKNSGYKEVMVDIWEDHGRGMIVFENIYIFLLCGST